MSFYPDSEVLSEEAFAQAATLPPEDGVAVLLHSLIGSLKRMPRSEALQMRAEIAKRFGGRYCRTDTCAMMAELIDAHLEAASGDQRAETSNEGDMTLEKMEITRISCAERLPATDTLVVLYSENTGPHQGTYTIDGAWVDDFGSVIQRVTHWWPLSPAEISRAS